VVPAERSYVLASDLKASQVDGLALFTKATDNVGRVGDGQDWYASLEYRAILPLRTRHIASDSILVDGVEANRDSADMAAQLRPPVAGALFMNT
jgi:hypothetical protein